MSESRFFLIKSEKDLVRLRSTLKSLCKKLEFKILERLHITVAITELVRIIASKAKEIAISLIAIREDEQDGIEMIMEIKGVDQNFLETALESFSLNGREEGIYMIKHLVDQIDVEKKGTSCRIIIKKWKGRNSDLRR